MAPFSNPSEPRMANRPKPMRAASQGLGPAHNAMTSWLAGGRNAMNGVTATDASLLADRGRTATPWQMLKAVSSVRAREITLKTARSMMIVAVMITFRFVLG